RPGPGDRRPGPRAQVVPLSSHFSLPCPAVGSNLRASGKSSSPESGCVMRAWALRFGVVSLVAVGLAGIPACGNKGGSGSAKPKIAVVSNCTDPFWDLCEAGAKKAGQDFDAEVLFRQPERLAAEVQKPIIDAW